MNNLSIESSVKTECISFRRQEVVAAGSKLVRRTGTCAVALAIGLALAVAPQPALSDALVAVNVTAVAEGYRTSKLLGKSVVNDTNQDIGKIDDIIIGRDRVLFSVIQVGGFLGVGGRLVAVPYTELVLDSPGGKITLPGASKDELKKLPEFKYIK